MKIKELLQAFYKGNKLPENGGVNDTHFNLYIGNIPLKLPNPTFRKQQLIYHDLTHVLYQRNTEWKGEAFIAGWEIATGLWQKFPIGLLSLWAFGVSIVLYPIQTLHGYRAGIHSKNFYELPWTVEDIKELSLDQLTRSMKKRASNSRKIRLWILFCMAIPTSITLVSFPLLLVILYFVY